MLALSPGPASAAPQSVERLPCGADWIAQARPEAESVEAAIRVDLEPADEPAHQVGIARLWADALADSGSTVWSRARIDGWLQDHGARYDIALLERSRGPAGLEISFRCAAEDLPEALAIARDLLSAPRVDERALESSKNRMLARLGRTAPVAAADRALEELLFGDAAPGARLPHKSDLAQLGAEDLLAFHRDHVRRSRLSIALDGPLPEAVAELAEFVCAALPGEPAGEGRAAPAPEAGAGGVLLDLPEADHAELRIALAPPEGAARPTPAQAAALLLHARYHTPKATVVGRPANAAAIPGAIDLEYREDGVLVGRLALPDDLAAAGLAALEQALDPPPGARLDPEKLAEARGGVLALLEPALELPRLSALLDRARHPAGADWAAAVADEARGLEAEAILAAVREHARSARRATVVAGPAPALQGLPELAVKSGVRQPRGDGAALALRERLLAALGGGERWAELDTLAVAGEAELPGVEGPVAVRVERDFRGGELVVRQELAGQASITVSTREASWLRLQGSIAPLDPERHAALRQAEERQLFRLLVELARGRELLLRAGAGTGGERLDLWRGAERWAWIQLGADGRPAAVGFDGPDGEPSAIELSEWTERDGLAYPALMRQPAKGTLHRWTRFEPGAPIDPELLVGPKG